MSSCGNSADAYRRSLLRSPFGSVWGNACDITTKKSMSEADLSKIMSTVMYRLLLLTKKEGDYAERGPVTCDSA